MKGIGIILVVIGHIYSNQLIVNWFYSFHMPFFFFEAGLVYAKKDIAADLLRRIQTIIVPYFVLGSFNIFYWYFIEKRFRDSEMSLIEAFRGLLSGMRVHLDFNVHLWFLPCFFVTVIVFNVFVNLGEKKLAIILSSIMSIIYIIGDILKLPFGIDTMFKYIAFYAVGYMLQKNISCISRNKNIYYAISVLLLAFNYILAFWGLTKGVMWFLTAAIGIVGMIAIAIAVGENKILQYCGRISIIILCFHGPVYRIIIKVLSVLFQTANNQVRNSLIYTLISTILSLIICAIGYEFVQKYIPWVIGKKKYSDISTL